MGNFIESYTARLSPRDHYNRNGVRLTSAAAIIRQDRANFYVYGLRDSEDEPDSFFSSKSNRARLEEMLENGRATRDAIDRVINGTPLIRVDIYLCERHQRDGSFGLGAMESRRARGSRRPWPEAQGGFQ